MTGQGLGEVVVGGLGFDWVGNTLRWSSNNRVTGCVIRVAG